MPRERHPVRIGNYSSWKTKGKIDLLIIDPPFGISFEAKKGNYNRSGLLVVDGYIEWLMKDYFKHISEVFEFANRVLKKTGSFLLFSSWLSSVHISAVLERGIPDPLRLNGKLYWSHNFAPPCKNRLAHNVYEIFWFTKSRDKYRYNNRCRFKHCRDGEKNLSNIFVKKEYRKEILKYPTMLPAEFCGVVLDHFSSKNSVVLDPMCGSGIFGVIIKLYYPDRIALLSDLNPNSRVVYDSLLDYYENKDIFYYK